LADKVRVLVTGGCGFLGSAFVDRARADGHEAFTLDRSVDADIVADIGDPAAVADAVARLRPDAAVHLAAALTDAAAADAVAATRINALGTAALFSACVAERVGRVIYASSNAAVGPCPEGSGDETKLAPRSIYGATKAFGEHLAQAMSQAGTTSFLALRFGWIYGPGRVRGWRVAQDLVERFARGESPIAYPDFPEKMDWTYVVDAAEVLVRSLLCPLPPFAAHNVAGDRRSIGEAVAYLRRRFPDTQVVPKPVIAPASGWKLVNDGLEARIGYLPATTLEEGLNRLLARFVGPG